MLDYDYSIPCAFAVVNSFQKILSEILYNSYMSHLCNQQKPVIPEKTIDFCHGDWL